MSVHDEEQGCERQRKGESEIEGKGVMAEA